MNFFTTPEKSMPIAVELYFDSASEEIIRDLWRAIAAAGFPSSLLEAGYRPHISLAICESLDVAAIRPALSSFAGNLSPFSCTLSHIGIFPTMQGVLFLGPTVTTELLDLHASFHTLFASYARDQHEYYLPGRWVPHCTLTYDISTPEIAGAMMTACQASLPIEVKLEEIGISDVSPVHCRNLCNCRINSKGG
jgi:2'-5' RNA ligase